MIKITKKQLSFNEAAERASKSVLNERAEYNIKKIDWMELNELLASLKEQIEYDINPDLMFWKVILEVKDGKAAIDIETKDIDEWDVNGWSVEDILSITDPTEYDLAITEDEFNGLKKSVLAEKAEIVNKIIPKIAKEWGFRNAPKKESVDTNAADSCSVIDLIERSLFHKGVECPSINLDCAIKSFDTDGNIETKDCYDLSQADVKADGDDFVYYLSLTDLGDTDLATTVAEKLKFKTRIVKPDEYQPKAGYKYVIALVAPYSVIDMPADEYLAENQIQIEDSIKESTRRDFDNGVTDAADNIIWAHFDDESAEELTKKSKEERVKAAFEYMRDVEVPWALEDMAGDPEWEDIVKFTAKELKELGDFAPELKDEIDAELLKMGSALHESFEDTARIQFVTFEEAIEYADEHDISKSKIYAEDEYYYIDQD